MPTTQSPSAIPIEKSVLASAIIMPECVEEIVESLDNSAFYRTAHKIYFDAIKHLKEAGAPVDLAGIGQYIQDKNLSAKASIVELAELTEEPVSANLQYHIRKLREKAAMRRVIEICNAGMKRALNPSGDADETLDYLRAEFDAIEIDADSMENMSSASEMAMDALERYEKSLSGELDLGVKTGYKGLDGKLSGLKPTDAIFLAARPSMGKTALAMNIIERSADPVLVFSLEQSSEQLFDRMVSIRTRIDLQRLATGLIHQSEWQRVHDALSSLDPKRIFIDDSSALSIGQIRSRARTMIRKHGIRLVIIDYIQLIRPDFRKDGNRNLEVGKIAQGIKNMAKEFKIPFLGISQLSRNLENRPNPNKVPKLSDLRDSGEIEQVADTVMFLYRPDVYNDESNMVTHNNIVIEKQAHVIVAKQRQGPTGRVIMRFEPDCVRFDNISFQEDGS